MTVRNATSYDLRAAGELSRRLTAPRTAPNPPVVNPPPARPVPIEAPRQSPVPRAQLRQAVPLPSVEPPRPQDMLSWSDFVGWASRCTGAQEVFVVDAQGFLIARADGTDLEKLENIGAELSAALHYFEKVSADDEEGLRSALLDYGDRRLAGVRGRCSGESFILGVVHGRSIADDTLRELRRWFVALVQKLA